MYGPDRFLAHSMVPSLRCFVQVVHCMVKQVRSFITLLCSGGALYGENKFVPSLRCFVQVVHCMVKTSSFLHYVALFRW